MQVLMSPILTPNVHTAERWASAGAGLLLAGGSLRYGWRGVPGLLAGAALVHRGVTGKCQVYRALGMRTEPNAAAVPYELGVRARAAITIARPRDEVFAFWRDLTNLPRFMRHLVSVDVQDEKCSRWVAEGPGGRQFRWNAEIIAETPGEKIAWKSLPESDLDSAGSVRLSDAPGGRGTEIRVEMQYNPPAGAVGAYVAKLFGREPEQQMASDLRRLKQLLESGEIASTEGQPKGGNGKMAARTQHQKTSEGACA